MPTPCHSSPPTKHCNGCSSAQPLENFTRNKTQRDGLSHRCKTCSNAASARWREKNPEKHKENLAAWYAKKGAAYKASWNKNNPKKYLATAATFRAAHPHKIRANNLRQYGITNEDWEQMHAEQGGRCAICFTDTPMGRGRFHVDHDHSTGKVRGLLCHRCNLGIGHLKDSPTVLASALRYLHAHGKALSTDEVAELVNLHQSPH